MKRISGTAMAAVPVGMDALGVHPEDVDHVFAYGEYASRAIASHETLSQGIADFAGAELWFADFSRTGQAQERNTPIMVLSPAGAC